MAVATEFMMLALLIGGVLVMSMQNRNTIENKLPQTGLIPTVDADIALADPMKVELTDVEYDKVKKAQFLQGSVSMRVQMIVKYMLDESRKMIDMQNYFDEALSRPGIVGIVSMSNLQQAFPAEYENWVAARSYCLNRANEFKNLWNELNQVGGFPWMAANQWVVQVPGEVLQRLDSYNFGTVEMNLLDADQCHAG